MIPVILNFYYLYAATTTNSIKSLTACIKIVLAYFAAISTHTTRIKKSFEINRLFEPAFNYKPDFFC